MDPSFGQLLETEWFQTVESLSLRFSQFGDSESQRFISAFPSLTELTVVYNPNISNAFILDLITSPNIKLRKIDLL